MHGQRQISHLSVASLSVDSQLFEMYRSSTEFRMMVSLTGLVFLPALPTPDQLKQACSLNQSDLG